ncbi:hypothetical protein GTP58_06290 [Duganella sp. CY15W]|uniref:S41 family peptidase n=1 Tax=Duganella sp. CY15W TaxID=2692172 RepID=UPI00136EBA80|nr:S41 family peptidase [Duganella sp. CY15W]MYM27926.1 hypothetical protein [Duganella sp. CY15W]
MTLRLLAAAAALLALPAHGEEITPESMRAMADAASVIASTYFKPVDTGRLLRTCTDAASQPDKQALSSSQKEEVCVRAMVATLDKDSAYLGREDWQALRTAAPAQKAQLALKAERLPGEVLLITPGQFTDATLEQLASALRTVDAAPKVSGIILDLRHCQGGLLTATIGVAAAFLPLKALVFKAQGNSPDFAMDALADPEYYGAGKPPFAGLPPVVLTLPLVVLVDAQTASGAEMVAAALQDHGRARIAGVRTAGRGMIQTLRMLSAQVALKLTSAEISRPNGRAIEGVGVTPDVMLASDVPDAIAKAQALLRR